MPKALRDFFFKNNSTPPPKRGRGYAGDGFFHIQKDLIAIGILIAYAIFSLIFIIHKSLKKVSASTVKGADM